MECLSKLSLYREATVNDIDQLHKIRMSVHENVLNNPDLVKHADYVTYLTVKGKGWLCEIEGNAVGFCILNLEDNSVWALFVSPEYEGKNIGKTLHDLMLDWYFSKHLSTLWLTTASGTRAEKLYRNAGWKEIGKKPNGEILFEITQNDWKKAGK